jgi:hypothetical protein
MSFFPHRCKSRGLRKWLGRRYGQVVTETKTVLRFNIFYKKLKIKRLSHHKWLNFKNTVNSRRLTSYHLYGKTIVSKKAFP